MFEMKSIRIIIFSFLGLVVTGMANGQIGSEMNSQIGNLHFTNPAAISKIELLAPRNHWNITLQCKTPLFISLPEVQYKYWKLGLHWRSKKANPKGLGLIYGPQLSVYSSKFFHSTKLSGKLGLFYVGEKQRGAVRDFMMSIGIEIGAINTIKLRDSNFRLWHRNDPILDLSSKLSELRLDYKVGYFFSKSLGENNFLYGGVSIPVPIKDQGVFSFKSEKETFIIGRIIPKESMIGFLANQKFDFELFYSFYSKTLNERNSLKIHGSKYLRRLKSSGAPFPPKAGVGYDLRRKTLHFDFAYYLNCKDKEKNHIFNGRNLLFNLSVGHYIPNEFEFFGPEIEFMIQIVN